MTKPALLFIAGYAAGICAAGEIFQSLLVPLNGHVQSGRECL